jgi:O-antigen ligase
MSPEAVTISLGAIAASVWAAVTVLRVRVLHMTLIYILATVCFSAELVRVGPLAPDRALLFVLIGLYVLRRATQGIVPVARDRLDYVGLALLGWLALSLATTSFTPLFGTEQPVWRLLSGYLLPLVLYWIARNVFNPEQDTEMLLRLMVIFGVYLALTGICERLHLWALVYPTFVRDPSVGVHFGRARGPLLASHSLGMWLTLCALAAHGLLPRLRPAGRALTVAAMFAMGVTLVLTNTRSAWLGAAFAGVVLVWLAYRGAARALILGGLAAAGMVVLLVAGDQIINPARKRGAQEARQSIVSRQALMDISWRMFKDKPLTGHGFGHYRYFAQDYYSISDGPASLHMAKGATQHSTFLSLLTEAGLVGLALFLALLLGWTRQGVELCRHAPDRMQRGLAIVFLGGMATFVIQMASVEMAFGPVDNSLIGFIAGCTAAALAKQRDQAAACSIPSQGAAHGVSA